MKILAQNNFTVGSQPPSGYLAWHEWAEIQAKGKLTQCACGICGLWKFPQELSSKEIKSTLKTSSGKSKVLNQKICTDCDNPKVSK